MGQNSSIQWCTHTFNPWRGCTKISPGCHHCYAEALSKRNPSVLGIWGDQGTRVVASESYWRQPINWNRAAVKAGERHRVFCASLADVFEDRPELVEPRKRLGGVIAETPQLDWLLLTKRPQSAREMIRQLWQPDQPWPITNIWLGVSVEDQARADERIPRLLEIPAVIRFLSIEPLLGPINLMETNYFGHGGHYPFAGVPEEHRTKLLHLLSWVIIGGESGHNARPMNVGWVESLRDQCKIADVPCFIKQLGAKPYTERRERNMNIFGDLVRDVFRDELKLKDSHGADWDDPNFPDDLKLREFPPC